MAYKTVYTEVEVDVDLEHFETDDLIEELELRDALPAGLPSSGHYNSKELIEQIYYHRQHGRDFTRELQQLFYEVLGKIV
jgi:hypothetical protein